MIIKEKTKLNTEEEFVKVVVDIEKETLAAYCELHIDCADELEEAGSERKNLWGANIFSKDNTIEFTSMINIRPKENNRSIEIQDPHIRQRVENVIRKFFILP